MKIVLHLPFVVQIWGWEFLRQHCRCPSLFVVIFFASTILPLLAAIYFIANFIELTGLIGLFRQIVFGFPLAIQRKYRVTNWLSCLIFMVVLIEGARLNTTVILAIWCLYGA